jgi:hypothetical protein
MNHYVSKDKHSTTHVYTGLTEDEFWDKLENVVLHQKHALKFGVSIGYTLVNRHDPFDVRRFHPATHNTSLFKNAPVSGAQSINTRKDAITNVEQLRQTVLAQTIDRPNSSYMLKSIDEFFLKNFERTHKLGSEEAVIPEVIRLNKHVINFPQPPQSTKCLFYCIAYHLQEGEKRPSHRMSAPTKAAVKKWLTFKGESFTDKTFPTIYKTLPPVDIYQLSDVEDSFKINIEVYAFDEETQEYSRAIDSTKSYDSTMSILSHNSHAMYITNPERFVGKHGCSKGFMVFATQERRHNHKKNKCQEAYIKKFVKEPSLFRPATNKISRLLSKYEVKDVDPFTEHYLVYDFEAILKPLNADKAAKRLTFTSAHIPVSVSVHNSLTDEAKCFVNDSPKDLLIDMFTHDAAKHKLIEEYNRIKYSKLFEKIEQRKQEAQERQKSEPNKITKAIVDKVLSEEGTITRFCATVPLIGFNSGRYDLNNIKEELIAAILQVSGCERITRRGQKTNDEKKPELSVRAILSGSGYMCLDAGGFKMLDISKYVAAGTSLRQYLKSYLGKCQCPDKTKYTCQMSKGHFPYEYITSFDKLNDPLPPRSAFNSKHRSTTLSDKEWKRVQWVWKHYNMKPLR